MRVCVLVALIASIQAKGGALAWWTPICLFIHWSAKQPPIMGDACIVGYTPIAYSEFQEI